MRTLVIHPSDRTTDFLDKIYNGIDAVVIRGSVRDSFLREQIAIADRVMLMGHGTPQGLLGPSQRMMIDQSHVGLLKTKKNLVGIWCNADGYFERYGLNGLYTGMIISEPMEARVFNVTATDNQIWDSNHQFAKSVKRGLELFDPEYAAEQVREFYTERPFAMARTNPVIQYNVQNIYDSRITTAGVEEVVACTS
jgi:hypothetical protein